MGATGAFFSVPDGGILSRALALTNASQDVTTNESTTSTSYANLTTSGPAVTLSPGIALTHFIEPSTHHGNTVGGVSNWMSVAINGAGANDVDGARGWTLTNDSTRENSRLVYATAQPSGATHTAKYRGSGGTVFEANRRLTGWC